MERSSAVSVLNVFDRVCNLVNERGEVVSLVTAEVGRGPFAVVVEPQRTQRAEREEEMWGFMGFVREETAVFIRGDVLQVGVLRLDMDGVQMWDARPVWEQVRPCMPGFVARHQCPGEPTILNELGYEQEWMGKNSMVRERLKGGVEAVLQGVKGQNGAECCQGVERLAGVGEGLTPAGDDFLMGVIMGLWATWADDEAEQWGRMIMETAVPYTTTLSAAWLQAAACGEVVEVWHQLIERMSEPYPLFSSQLAAVQRILAMGHTSGKAAWAGFVSTII
jgi:hypothetical protein